MIGERQRRHAHRERGIYQQIDFEAPSSRHSRNDCGGAQRLRFWHRLFYSMVPGLGDIVKPPVNPRTSLTILVEILSSTL
jgi:hypothetical protein